VSSAWKIFKLPSNLRRCGDFEILLRRTDALLSGYLV
jgi:hypothetical protein